MQRIEATKKLRNSVEWVRDTIHTIQNNNDAWKSFAERLYIAMRDHENEVMYAGLHFSVDQAWNIASLNGQRDPYAPLYSVMLNRWVVTSSNTSTSAAISIHSWSGQ